MKKRNQRTTQNVPANSTLKRTLLILGFSLLGASLLTGCDHYADHEPYLIASNVQTKHVIDVVKKPQAIRVSVQPQDIGLSQHQEKKVKNFLRAYAANPQGQIIIKAPSGASNESAVRRALGHIRELTKEHRILRASVDLRTYFAEAQHAPPIRMSFEQHIALASECDDWSKDLAKTRQNTLYPNFGCAYQNNLAAMVAEPRDFLQPRGSDPSSRPSSRRDITHDKFVRGETSGSEKSSEEKSTISDVAKDSE